MHPLEHLSPHPRVATAHALLPKSRVAFFFAYRLKSGIGVTSRALRAGVGPFRNRNRCLLGALGSAPHRRLQLEPCPLFRERCRGWVNPRRSPTLIPSRCSVQQASLYCRAIIVLPSNPCTAEQCLYCRAILVVPSNACSSKRYLKRLF